MKYRISIDKHQFEVRVDNLRARPILATVNGETFEVWPEGQEASPAAAAVPGPAPLLRDTALAPEAPLLTVQPDLIEATPAIPGSANRTVRAPLPGVIIALSVQPGAVVTVGQELCVLEAMKMKNPVRATRPGTIRAVHVVIGQTVKHQDLLLEYSD
jgi:glutaconyl-CoA/methylmalonyl-CoA decarboxylase subunit gamma